MNILYIDIDSLRPDHLGCYGYPRNTSPNIDAVAAEGLRFKNCYTPDAPCLPSRSAMTTGRFGFHTGVVNHGGARSVMFNYGKDRGFRDNWTNPNWASQMKGNGYHTVAFSPFAERHGAWHWYAGFMEIHNTGGGGQETADVIAPQVNDWLDRKAAKDSASGGQADKPFFMWLNVWDPHTPYRTPREFGNPFIDDPIPAWYTEEVRKNHWQQPGPHSAREVNGYDPAPEWMFKEREDSTISELQPKQISDMGEARKMFDGYDTGVAYADKHVGEIIQKLKDLGLYENTAIIISADHGENLGELCVYGDHQTADHFTHNIPMIVRWPGVTDSRAGELDHRMMYNIDVAATTLELAGKCNLTEWDGKSFAHSIAEEAPHREALVLSQLAWCAQRSARWDHYICIETYHDSWHDYPDYMVFDLDADPHEQFNLAEKHPELVEQGKKILTDWKADCLATAHVKEDPKDTVIAEGGPLHARDGGSEYLQRLRETGRGEAAERLKIKHQVQP